MVRGRAVAGAGSPFGKAVSRTGGVTYAFTRGTDSQYGTAQHGRIAAKPFRILSWRCAAFGCVWISRGAGRGWCRAAAGVTRGFLPQAIEASAAEQAEKFEAFDEA